MDRHNQLSQDNQFSFSEEKSSSSLTLLQEQQLSRLIIWLTFFLEIAVGICLTLFGELRYVLAGYIPHAFCPTSSIIYKLLGPLIVASMGFAFIIQGKLK